MGDTRAYWNKEFTTEFIEAYRGFPCLWQTKSKEYTNKNLKNRAYYSLTEMCKKVEPQANCEYVKKKIQSMRGAFRKEVRKVERSMKSGASADDVYTPTLWYFDLLLFTRDHETPSTSVSNIDEDSNNRNGIQDDGDDQDEEEIENTQITQLVENSEDVDQSESQYTRARNDKNVRNENIENSVPQVEDRFITASRKRKQTASKEERVNFLKACTDALTKKDTTADEAFGINVSAKLSQMENVQRIHAEMLISQILHKGLLGKLTDNTTIRDSVPLQTRTSSRSSYSYPNNDPVETNLNAPSYDNNNDSNSNISRTDNYYVVEHVGTEQSSRHLVEYFETFN